MRILHVVPSYYPAVRYGGPIYSVHGLCKSLVRRGHDVQVYTTNIDGQGDLDVPVDKEVDIDGIGVHYFPVQFPRRIVFSPKLKGALSLNIRSFDIVHIHSIYLYPTIVGAKKAHENGIPYLIAPRGMMVKDLVRAKSKIPKSLWFEFFGKDIFRKAAGFHFTSLLEEKEFERFGFRFRGRKIIVPNGLELSRIPAPDTTSDVIRKFRIRKPYVLSLGRINWEKGLDRAVEALRYVSHVELVIAGNDEEGLIPKLQDQIQRLGLKQRVKFIGTVHGDDKWSLFKQASCFILPSHSENFGNVVLEAMATGTPVIVTPQVGLSNVVKESGAGFVVNGTPKELAKTVNTLLESSAASQKMGKLGMETVRNSYTWDVISESMELGYRDIIEEQTRN